MTTGEAYVIVGLKVKGNSSSNSVPINELLLENIKVKGYDHAGECVYANVKTKNIDPPLPEGQSCVVKKHVP